MRSVPGEEQVRADADDLEALFLSTDQSAEAAVALAVQILGGARCKCGRRVVLFGGEAAGVCLWKRQGDRVQSECDAPTVDVSRGGMNRAARRSKRRNPDLIAWPARLLEVTEERP